MIQVYVVRCLYSVIIFNVVFRFYNNNILVFVIYQFIFFINVGNVLFDEMKKCWCLVNFQVVEIMLWKVFFEFRINDIINYICFSSFCIYICVRV